MPRLLVAWLAVCLCAPTPASALTIAFTGTVQVVSDDLEVLDTSVALGTAVTGSYEVDPSGVVGASPFPVGPARLAFQLGSYGFDATDASHTIALIDDRVVVPPLPPDPAVTVDVWQSGEIVAADLVPAANPGGDFAGYAAQIEFFDSDSTAFDGGETEPFVLADLVGWENVRLTLNSLAAAGGGAPAIDGRVQVQVRLDSWTPVPEAHTALLLSFGLILIAARAR